MTKNNSPETSGAGAAGKSFLLALLGGTIAAGLGKMVLDKIRQDKRAKQANQTAVANNPTKPRATND